MKIKKITPWVINFPWKMRVGIEQDEVTRNRELILAQVETDEGITGWGEITCYTGLVANRPIAAMIDQLNDLVVGENTNGFKRLWQKIFRSFTYVGTRGATTAMISGIDIAI